MSFRFASMAANKVECRILFEVVGEVGSTR
jgi:hypothetical protein